MKHFCKDFFFLIYSTLIFLTKDVALWLVFFLLSLPFILKDRFTCHTVSQQALKNVSQNRLFCQVLFLFFLNFFSFFV